MDQEPLDRLTLYLDDCRALPESKGLPAAVRFFQERGGAFLHGWTAEPHPDPCSAAGPDGTVMSGLSLQHQTLQPDLWARYKMQEMGKDPEATPAGGSFSFFANSRTVGIGQWVEFPDGDLLKVERCALGLLQFLLEFAPALRPAYGWVDRSVGEFGRTNPSDEFAKAGAPRLLCWANYFAPEVVAVAGRDFLGEAPGWRVVDLEGGGVLYVATESFLEWHHGEHKEVVRYFRKRFPKLKKW